MSAGHIAMAFDQSFLIALALLIVGSGCLKGNISAQVGQLYPRDGGIAADAGLHDLLGGDQYRRGRRARWPAAPSRRSMAGMPASRSPAALMILALVIYLPGQRHLARRPRAAAGQAGRCRR